MMYYNRAVCPVSTKSINMWKWDWSWSENKRLMASMTILCQAVLTAKGGLEDAHFMRHEAFTSSDFMMLNPSIDLLSMVR